MIITQIIRLSIPVCLSTIALILSLVYLYIKYRKRNISEDCYDSYSVAWLVVLLISLVWLVVMVYDLGDLLCWIICPDYMISIQ